MAGNIITFVGGPANGQCITRSLDGRVATINVPVLDPAGGFGSFQYTLRRCRDGHGNVVEVLAPAGRPIDPAYLAANKLTN